MTRNPLPPERAGITRKLRIADLEGYVTVNTYPDGRPGEISITLQKTGALERGLSRVLGDMMSLALQHGAPIDAIADLLAESRFEPAGMTGNPEIPMAKSICDYLGKWLRQRFPKKEGQPQ